MSRALLVGLVACVFASCARAEVAQPSAAVGSQRQALQQRLSREVSDLRVEPIGRGVGKVDLKRRFAHATVIEHAGESKQVRRRTCLDSPVGL